MKASPRSFFYPSGPFAILPMTPAPESPESVDGKTLYRSSLVWTEKEEAAPAYLALDDEAFRTEIENRFGPYLGAVSLTGPRWSYPLAFTLAQKFIAPRLALIGDGAHAIHPIAGQGYNPGCERRRRAGRCRHGSARAGP